MCVKRGIMDNWTCRFESDARMEIWQERFAKKGDEPYVEPNKKEVKRRALLKEIEHAASYEEYLLPGFPKFNIEWPRHIREEWRDLAIAVSGFVLRLQDWDKKKPILFRQFKLDE